MTLGMLCSRHALLVVGHIAMLASGCGLTPAPEAANAVDSAGVTESHAPGNPLGQEVAATAGTEAESAPQVTTALSESSIPLVPTESTIDGEASTAGSVVPGNELGVESPKATDDNIGEQSPNGDTSQERPRIATERAGQQAAEALAEREAEEAAEAAAAARQAREKHLARCREIATEANRAIEHHRSTGRFDLDDILNRAHQDYEALAASFTRTIRALHGQIAAHETVIASVPCRQAMSDATMQAWVNSRHESVTKLSDSKENCRSAFFEPMLLRIATLPPACE